LKQVQSARLPQSVIAMWTRGFQQNAQCHVMTLALSIRPLRMWWLAADLQEGRRSCRQLWSSMSRACQIQEVQPDQMPGEL